MSSKDCQARVVGITKGFVQCLLNVIQGTALWYLALIRALGHLLSKMLVIFLHTSLRKKNERPVPLVGTVHLKMRENLNQQMQHASFFFPSLSLSFCN